MNQFAGIGDVIFAQTLAHNYLKDGHSVLWPVLPQFVGGLQRAYPKIEFKDWKQVDIDYNRQETYLDWDRVVIPLRWAREILKVPYTDCMAAKYLLFLEPVERWREHAMWERDHTQERHLFDALGLKEGQPYNLINNTFRSDFSGKVRVKPGNDYPNVFMKHYEGFSLFDWHLTIRNAAEIHTVSTAILYMLEIMDLKQPIHLYPRQPDEVDFRNVEYLFTKPYIRHL